MKILKIDDQPFYKIIFNSSGPRSTIRKCILPCYKVKVDELPKGISSFIATSDLQGREIGGEQRLVGEQVSEELALLEEMGGIPKVDFILLAGDLYDYPDCRKLGGTGEVTSVWNSFAENFPKVIGVHGNHDIVDQSKMDSNTIVLDGNLVEHQSLTFGGVSGIIGRVDRNQRKSEEEFKKLLTKVTSRKPDIILLHQGPNDIDNEQLGEPFIREHFETKGESIVLFGHCHWKTPFITLGGNQLLNIDCKLYLFEKEKTRRSL